MKANPGHLKNGTLPLAGGLILAVCLFLPATRGCDEVIIPYNEPWYLWLPYLFGFTTALFFLLLKLKPGQFFLKISGVLHSITACTASLLFGYSLGYSLYIECVLKDGIMAGTFDSELIRDTVFAIIWTLSTVLILKKIEKGIITFSIWSTLLGGANAVIWFVYLLFVLGIEDIYYGLWLSLISSIIILTGALSYEAVEKCPDARRAKS